MQNVLFTNEYRFGLYPDSQSVSLWRATGTKNTIYHKQDRLELQRRHNYGMGRYILEPVLGPYIHSISTDLILLYNNATSHTARVTKKFLEEQNIRHLDWLDLHPIEHSFSEQFLSTTITFNLKTYRGFHFEKNDD